MGEGLVINIIKKISSSCYLIEQKHEEHKIRIPMTGN
jgi:hypothetical protein